MRHAIAFQLIRHNLSRFATMLVQQSLEETRSGCSITTCLEKHIDHLAILVNGPPQVLLFAIYLHKHFVDVKCIAEPLMPTSQSFGILKAELIAPQTNRFIAYGNTALSQYIFDVSMAEVESIVKPNGVLDDFSGKPVSLV